MALTSQQTADVRRFMGYPAQGEDIQADDSRDFAYGWVSPGTWQTLFHRLNNLLPEDENTLVTVYLANLYLMETDIVGARSNLDTEKAAVWTWNKNEISDRTKLLDMWRRRLCGFLGVAPGPYLGQGGIRVARC